MRVVRLLVVTVFFAAIAGVRGQAQEAPRLERLLGIGTRQKPGPPLAPPQGLQDHVANGKLVLSLDDTIRLALSNSTDIRLDRAQIEFAQNNLHRAHGPFDPLVTSSFADNRTKSPTITQTQGAPILETLSQTTAFGLAKTFQTGTNFQSSFGASKLSTNNSFSTLNPSIATDLQFSVTQPLLRNFGLFPNRAPILIAQRNLKQARASFQGEVNDIIFRTVGNYWNVILARESLVVQRKSLEEAQKSYDHDKKALGLGALPPLDIYRSESQVASRRVGVIQAEYALKQAEDQFRQIVGADLDPAIRVLDLELIDQPEPLGDLPNTDIATALARALANRPEFEAARQQLASDELIIRLAHNSLKPDLEFSGFYIGNGAAGNEFNTATPPQLIGKTGLGDSLSQTFHFTYPTYGAALSLSLTVKNHSAEANLADADASRRRDQYRERQTNQNITLEVSNAVHALEQAKLSIEASKVALDLAQKSLRADERKYELGAETVFFVLDSQIVLAQAELNLIRAQINFQVAVAQVDHATGDLLDHHHVQILDPQK
ncbi:MAG TPA: TolC family protein [Candidatus Limnocylindria bacterium]|jgi:outer membrane protein TolC|nr:TolC family protein [Candidatus Limnocylindria bacterium]